MRARPAYRPPWWLWAGFVVACVAGVVLVKRVAQREDDALDARLEKVTRAREARDRATERVHAARSRGGDGKAGPWTRAALERELNGGAPFRPAPPDEDDPDEAVLQRFAWTAPDGGGDYEFTFRRGRLSNVDRTWTPPATGPPPDPLYGVVVRVRRRVSTLSGWAWAVLLGLTIPLMRTRAGPSLARLLLAAAVVFTAAAEARRDGRYHSEPVWHGLLMLGVSAVFVWVGRVNEMLRRDERVRRRLCLTCGYDLRATPDRCPECGTSAPRATAPAA
jgi:hypothetical protein